MFQRRNIKGWAVASALGFATVAGTASGQSIPWVNNPSVGDGIGIRTGDFVFHPSIGTDFGYDSNYYQTSDGTVTETVGGTTRVLSDETPVTSLRWQFVPSFRFSTISPGEARARGGDRDSRKVYFGVNANMVLNQVIPLTDTDEDLQEKTTVSGGAGLDLALNPRGEWGLNLNGAYERTAQPSTSPVSPLSLNSQVVSANAGPVWRPDGGKFTWSLGYLFNYNNYEADALGTLDYMGNYGTTNMSYNVAPRTAILLSGQGGAISWLGDGTENANSADASAQLGLKTRIGPRFSLGAGVGWSGMFFDENAIAPHEQQNASSPTGQVTLSYSLKKGKNNPRSIPVGPSDLVVGYSHDLSVATVGNYLTNDRVYASLGYFSGKLALTGRIDSNFVHYQPTYFSLSQTAGQSNVVKTVGYTTTMLSASVFLEYRFVKQIGLGLNYQFTSNLAPTEIGKGMIPLNYDPVNPANVAYDDARFARNQVFLSLRWFM